MKEYLIILIAISTIFSCSNKNAENSGSKDNPVAKGSFEEPIRTDEIQINTKIPFGCPNLTTKYWEADPENYGRLKQPEEKEFNEIGECFARINNVNTLQLKPEIVETKHIKIGRDFKNTIYYDTVAQQNIDSLKYRLPDIGNYQCYYFFGKSINMYGDYGNLLLLDPKLKKGKTLNIYYEVGGDQHVNFRYFYLDGDTIRIYEGSCYDDGCSLTEKFTVEIKTDGQISINELK